MKFKIGKFAQVTGVSIRLLRYYDEIGLFKPAHTDAESGYRYYLSEQIPEFQRLLALRDLGLSLEQVEKLMRESVSTSELRGMLRLKQAELQQEFDTLQARLHRVETRLNLLESTEQEFETEVVLKSLPAMTVMALEEHQHPPRHVGYLFDETYSLLRRHRYGIRSMFSIHETPFHMQEGQHDGQPPYHNWAVYALEPTPETDIPLPDGRLLRRTELPGLELVASLIHLGEDYTRRTVHIKLMNWMHQHGYQLSGPTRVVYLYRNRYAPQAHISELQFPLRKISGEKEDV